MTKERYGNGCPKDIVNRLRGIGAHVGIYIPADGFNQQDDELEFQLDGIDCSVTHTHSDPVFWIDKGDGTAMMHQTLKALVQTVTWANQ